MDSNAFSSIVFYVEHIKIIILPAILKIGVQIFTNTLAEHILCLADWFINYMKKFFLISYRKLPGVKHREKDIFSMYCSFVLPLLFTVCWNNRPFLKLRHEHHLPHFYEVGKVTVSQRDLGDVFKNSVRVMHLFSKVIWESITTQ